MYAEKGGILTALFANHLPELGSQSFFLPLPIDHQVLAQAWTGKEGACVCLQFVACQLERALQCACSVLTNGTPSNISP